jgi:hypothetical protein
MDQSIDLIAIQVQTYHTEDLGALGSRQRWTM